MDKFPKGSPVEHGRVESPPPNEVFKNVEHDFNERLRRVFQSDEEIGRLFDESGTLTNTHELAEKIAHTADTSLATLMLFQSLIPKAHVENRKPKRKYNIDKQEAIEQNDFIQHRVGLHFDTENSKEGETKTATVSRNGVAITQMTQEQAHGLTQLQHAQVTYDLGLLRISEELYNSIFARKRTEDGRVDYSVGTSGNHLRIGSLKFQGGQGAELDVLTLLPQGYELKSYVEVDRDRKGQRDSLDQYLYQAGKIGDEAFYCDAAGFRKEIYYGDLTVPGNRLSLLHEIAHGWQGVYGMVHAKQRLGEALGSTAIQQFADDLISKSDPDTVGSPQWREDAAKKFETMCDERKHEEWQHIISYDVDKVLTSIAQSVKQEKSSDAEPAEVGLGEIVKRIDAKRLRPYIDDFVREERDAWAHAIRVMRFLRTRGIDIEPNIHSLRDLQELMYGHQNRALASYELSMNIIPTIPRERFVRPIRQTGD